MRGSRSITAVLVVTIAVVWLHLRPSRPFNSVVEQSLHYFARPSTTTPPHTAVSASLYNVTAAWTGTELQPRTSEWLEYLDEIEVEELRAAVRHAEGILLGRSIAELQAADFPLRLLSRRIARWRQALGGVHGLGFVLIKGAPVHEWTETQASASLFGCDLQVYPC